MTVPRKLTSLYSIGSLKPIISVDARRKHFSYPIIPYGRSSIIAK
jgi:hypothetical protein